MPHPKLGDILDRDNPLGGRRRTQDRAEQTRLSATGRARDKDIGAADNKLFDGRHGNAVKEPGLLEVAEGKGHRAWKPD